MRLRVYGFCFETKRLPKSIHPVDVFASLRAHPTLQEDSKIRHGGGEISVVSPLDNSVAQWPVGVILKVRDTRSFTKLTESNGRKTLTSEVLEKHEALAETNFFIVNPDTGSGLYAHYHQSASMSGDFGSLVHDCGVEICEARRRDAAADASLSPAARKAAMRDLRGTFWAQPLVRPEDFKEIVAKFHRVTHVRIKVNTLSEKRQGIFGGYSWAPASETVEITVPEFAPPVEVADGISAGLQNKTFESATVYGRDGLNREVKAKKEKNPFVFDDIDYDSVMHSFSLDLADPQASLASSSIVTFLADVARRRDVWQLLRAKR